MDKKLTESMVLLKRVKRGDQEALNAFYRRYLSRLHKIVRLKLGREIRSKVESMDVVQEVMAQSINDIENFKPQSEGALIHWFATRIENKIREMSRHFHAKKRNIRAEIELEKTAHFSDNEKEFIILPGPDKTPSHITEKKQDSQIIEKALDSLDAPQKNIVILKMYEGLTFVEIAKIQGRKTDTVRKSFNKAMAQLTTALETLKTE